MHAFLLGWMLFMGGHFTDGLDRREARSDRAAVVPSSNTRVHVMDGGSGFPPPTKP